MSGRRSIADADDKVLLGGGAGIALGGNLCTLTTIGTDGSGELVSFTDSRCGGPGATVAAAGGPVVGTVAAANDDLHYAVIKFDAAKVAPIPNFDGFAINGVGPTPGYRQLVCQQSRATGHFCAGVIPNPNRPGIATLGSACRNPDDDGAPVTADDLLIGMIRDSEPPGPPLAGLPCPYVGGPGLLPIFPDAPKIVLISAILDDLNARGGPGAGFTPVGT